MTTISLFTPVSYVRPRSYAEETLSILSHYFYLGGDRAKVIRNDEVQLERGKISWHTIALKIASYVLLFPLAVTLFAINLGLRYQHSFTIIRPSTKPKKELPTESNFQPQEESVSFVTEKRKGIDKDFSATLSKDQPQVVSPALLTQKKNGEPFLEAHQKTKESLPSVIAVTAQNVENVRQQVLVSISLTEDFSQPSKKNSHPSISPLDDKIPLKHSEAISSHNEEVKNVLNRRRG